MTAKPFSVIQFSLGEKDKSDEIIFGSVEELNIAVKEIDNGNDIYVEKEGIVTLFPHQMLSAKIYDGRIRMSAKGGK